MTTERALALVEKWDRAAKDANRPDIRKHLWRIMYALDGFYESKQVIDDLDALVQTPEVEEIRELLKLELQTAPLWAGRV